MDALKSVLGGGNKGAHEKPTNNATATTSTTTTQGEPTQQQSGGAGGFLGGFSNKLNSAAGGGPESEKNEDGLDKGIDYVQEHFLGQGPQNNESAIEQAKDKQMANFIRSQYKSTTGKEFPIKQK